MRNPADKPINKQVFLLKAKYCQRAMRESFTVIGRGSSEIQRRKVPETKKRRQ